MTETRLSIKQVLLTAIITCIFTVVAGVGTYLITTKKAGLSYSMVSGPALSVQGFHKKIFSIQVENSGRKEISDATIIVEIKEGNIEESSYEIALGIIANETKTNKKYSLVCPTLNPHEKILISLLATVPTPDYIPPISVRAKGIKGESKDKESEEKVPVVFLLAGVIAAVLGFITSTSPFVRRFLKFTPISILARMSVHNGSMIGPFERNELVAYILGLCSLKKYSEQIRFAPSEISFRGAADYIVSEAITASSEEKLKFISALKCLLLIKRINSDSVNVIKAALKKLGNISDDEIKDIQKMAMDEYLDPVKLRESIARLVADENKQGIPNKSV